MGLDGARGNAGSAGSDPRSCGHRNLGPSAETAGRARCGQLDLDQGPGRRADDGGAKAHRRTRNGRGRTHAHVAFAKRPGERRKRIACFCCEVKFYAFCCCIQVPLDTKLYTRKKILELREKVVACVEVFLEKAKGGVCLRDDWYLC